MGLKDDNEILARQFIVYDSLHAYCQWRVSEEKQ